MAVTLRSLEVTVPDTVLHQDQVREVFASQPGMNRLATRLVGAAFDSSGIERRHSAVTEMDLSADIEVSQTPQFFDATTRQILNPTTGARNELYVQEASRLYVDAAAAALASAQGIDRPDVTHVITVSCTGFFSPRPGLPHCPGSRPGSRGAALSPGVYGLLCGVSRHASGKDDL